MSIRELALDERNPYSNDNYLTLSRTDFPSRQINTSPISLSNVSASVGFVKESPEGPGPTWPRDWRAYRTLAGCFFLMFNSWGLVNAYGTFASFYKEHLMPRQDVLLFNLIGSTESFIVLLFSFMVGRLLDTGYSGYILFSGFVLVSLGMFMLSLSSGDGGYNQGNYGLVWVTEGLVAGLGMACFFVASSQSE